MFLISSPILLVDQVRAVEVILRLPGVKVFAVALPSDHELAGPVLQEFDLEDPTNLT